MFSNTSKGWIDTAKVAILIIAFAVAITVAIQIYSYIQYGSTKYEQVYGFVISAEGRHDLWQSYTCWTYFEDMFELIINAQVEDIQDLRTTIKHGLVSANNYQDLFFTIPIAIDALDMFESIMEECSLIQNSYGKLLYALTELDQGNQSAFIQYTQEAEAAYYQAVSLRLQNEIDLEELRLETERELTK